MPAMSTSASIVTFTVGVLVSLISVAVSRQMCYTCQFVSNGPGLECATAPLNWTGGEVRMKCPTMCTTMAEFDATTGKPTFFHRGCGVAPEGQKDGCTDNGARHSCFYWCGDGQDYCNDKSIPRSPITDKEEETDYFNGGPSVFQTSRLSTWFNVASVLTVWAVFSL